MSKKIKRQWQSVEWLFGGGSVRKGGGGRRRPRLEVLEDRVVLTVAPTELITRFGALSSAIDSAFNTAVANKISANLPLIDAPLVASGVLSAQADPLFASAAGVNAANPSATVTEFLNKVNAAVGGFAASNIVEPAGGSSASFDLTLTPLNPTTVSRPVKTGQQIDIGPFKATFANDSMAVNFTHRFDQIKARVTVSPAGVSITPAGTDIAYRPSVSAASLATVSGSIAGVTISGTAGLGLNPVINVIGTTADVASSPQVTLPLSVTLDLKSLPHLTYSATFTSDLNNLTAAPATSGEKVSFAGVDIQVGAGAPSPSDQLIKQVIASAAGPLLRKYDALIPNQVTQILLGTTELFADYTVADVLGGTTPLTLLGLAADIFGGGGSVSTTIVPVLEKLLQADQFASQLNGEANSNPSGALKTAKEELGLSFPVLDDPLGAVKKILNAEVVQLVNWELNAVELIKDALKAKNVPPAVIDAVVGAYVEPDGQTIKIDLSKGTAPITDTILEELAGLVGANKSVEFAGVEIKVLDVIKQAVRATTSGFGNVSGVFSLRAVAELGVDSTFLTRPAANLGDVADSVFIKSGDIFDFQFDKAGFFVQFPPAGAGLNLFENPLPPINVPPPGNPLEDLREGAEDAAEIAGETISREVSNGLAALQSGGQAAIDYVKTGLDAAGNFFKNILDYAPSGSFGATVKGHFTVAIPAGPEANSPDRLTASEFAQLFKQDPLCWLNTSGGVAPTITADLKLGNTTVIDFERSFPFDFTSSCSGGGGGGNSTGGGVPADLFAEVVGSELRVYGSTNGDSIRLSTFSDGRLVAFRGATGLLFAPAGVTSATVILTDGTRSSPGTPPRDGGDDVVVIAPEFPSFPVVVVAGTGNDHLSAYDGPGRFFGGRVNFFGNDGTDRLLGGAGDSFLFGEDDGDILTAGTGYSYLDGGAGDDRAFGLGSGSGLTAAATSRGVMVGGTGENRLGVGTISRGDWTLIGGSVGAGATDTNTLIGGFGNDLLIAGNAQLNAGSYTADPAAASRSLLLGGPGNDTLFGGDAGSTLIGGWINSSVDAGFNTLFGGVGNDRLFAGNVNRSTVSALTSSRTAPGGGTLSGGPGNDQLHAANGRNELNGGDGNDLFFALNPAGGLLAAGQVFLVDGGAGDDELSVRGNLGTSFRSTYAAAATFGNGSLVTGDGALTQTINFQNLDRFSDITRTASLTVDGVAAASQIVVADGPVHGGFQTTAVTSDTFIPVRFSRKTLVQVEGGVTSDRLTVNLPTTAPNLQTLVLDGEGGGDTFAINQAGAGTSFISVEDTGATGTDEVIVTGTAGTDAYTVTDTRVLNDAETVAYDGDVEVLTLNAGDGGDRVDVQATSAAATFVNAQGDDDEITLGSTTPTLDALLGPVTIDGGNASLGGGNTLTINDQGDLNLNQYFLVRAGADNQFRRDGTATATYSNIEVLTLNVAATAGSVVRVENPGALENTVNGGAGVDNVTVTGVLAGTELTINGREMADTVNVEDDLATILGPVTAHGGLGDDHLNISNAAGNASSYLLTSDRLTSSAMHPDGILYTNFATLDLSLSGQLAQEILNVQSINGGTDTMVVAGAGDDFVNVGSATQTLDTILGPLFIQGDAGDDVLNLDNRGGTSRDGALSEERLTGFGTHAAGIRYASLSELNLDLSDTGADTLAITATADGTGTADGTVTTVRGNGGLDVLTVGSDLARIDGKLILDGGVGDDELNVSNLVGAAGAGVLTDTTLTGFAMAAAGITYRDFLDLDLDLSGNGDDTLFVRATHGGPTRVNGHAGADRLDAGDAGSLDRLAGPLAFDGGADADTLRLLDGADALPHTYRLSPFRFDRSVGLEVVTYADLEHFRLFGGTQANTYDIDATSATRDTVIHDGESGSDFVIQGDGLTAANAFNANGGDDGYVVNAGLGVTGTAVALNAGAGRDDVVFNGRAGDDSMELSLTAPVGDHTLFGLGQAIDSTLLEDVDIFGQGGGNSLAIADRTGVSYGAALALQQGMIYRPDGPDSGDFSLANRHLSPFVDFDQINVDFSINGDADGGGDRDTLSVLAASDADFVSPLGEVPSDDGADTITASDTAVRMTNAALGELRSVALAQTNGNVTFQDLIIRAGGEAGVDGDTITAAPSNRLNLFVDGMEPVSGDPADRLDVQTTGRRELRRSRNPRFGPVHTRIVQTADEASVGWMRVEEVARVGVASAASDAGAGANVLVRDVTTGETRFQFAPYPGFGGVIKLASGDLNGDAIADLAVVVGSAGPTHVVAYDGVEGTQMHSFVAFENFLGGGSVAIGDVNADGSGDLIVGSGFGSRPHVKAFGGAELALAASFFAYAPGFLGGLNVGAGYVDRDGFADIVFGPANVDSSHVRVVSGAMRGVVNPTGEIAPPAQMTNFLAFGPLYRGGISVALGDLDGDRRADVLAGAGSASVPSVGAFSVHDGRVLASFNLHDPFAPQAIGGITTENAVRVGAADMNGDGTRDLVLTKGPSFAPILFAYEDGPLSVIDQIFLYDPKFSGGLWVAGSK